MDTTVHNTYSLGQPTLEVMAGATLALDKVVQAGNQAQTDWSLTQRALATLVLAEIIADPDWRMSHLVWEALGGEFFAGPVESAAQRLGFLTVDAHGWTVTNASPYPDLVQRIERAAG